jgi:hypothetical protein
MQFRPLFADTVAYWERKRLIYNGVLAILTAACWGADILSGGPRQWLGAAFVLLFFAGIANALYCFAYPIDLALQMTPLKESWQRWRWLMFAAGMVAASILALWTMLRSGMA